MYLNRRKRKFAACIKNKNIICFSIKYRILKIII